MLVRVVSHCGDELDQFTVKDSTVLTVYRLERQHDDMRVIGWVIVFPIFISVCTPYINVVMAVPMNSRMRKHSTR